MTPDVDRIIGNIVETAQSIEPAAEVHVRPDDGEGVCRVRMRKGDLRTDLFSIPYSAGLDIEQLQSVVRERLGSAQ